MERLQALRGEMPQFPDGLQLLALALAEKRNDIEAIHVYEQLHLLLVSKDVVLPGPAWQKKRRVLSIDLLKATSTAQLDTWQSTHEAVAAFEVLFEQLQKESESAHTVEERAAYTELLAHTAVQLAYTYARYLSHLREHTVAEVFGASNAQKQLRVSEQELSELRTSGAPVKAKQIVHQLLRKISEDSQNWLLKAK